MPRKPKIHPDCEICGNAYGTDFVCRPCRNDPVNAAWVTPEEPPVEREPQLSPRKVEVITALARVRFGQSTETRREMSTRLGVGENRLSETHKQLSAHKLYKSKRFRDRLIREGKNSSNFEPLYTWGHYERALSRAAWFEWRCSREEPSLELDPPRWFLRDELGYDGDASSTYLSKTCEHLAETNAQALCTLDEPHLRVTYPKDFYADPLEDAASVEDAPERGRDFLPDRRRWEV